MANRHNDWEKLLEYANEDLGKNGYSLHIIEDEEGYYSCEIWHNGKQIAVYAENYFEEELTDLVTDAWHHVIGTYIIK